jgi:hypothetical protein
MAAKKPAKAPSSTPARKTIAPASKPQPVSAKNWSLNGSFDPTSKPNLMGQAFAVLVAAQTFTDPAKDYPWIFGVIVIIGAGWVGYNAIKAKAILGVLAIPVSLIWLNPTFGGSLFHNVPVFFFTHAAMALIFGMAGYTFMRNPSTKKK